MKRQKSFLIAFVCLVFGFTATILVAQQAQDEFSAEEVGAGAKLVVTSVSGPSGATHTQTISVTYNVKNGGTVASGPYKVGLYLSRDKTIDPATDRLLKRVPFPTGLAPGFSKKTTTKVLIPINGLSGKYYYGAIVGSSKKTSSKQVSLVRYSLEDNNETVKDHKTGLIWQKSDDGTWRKWDAAGQYCENLELGGHDDWRVPRIDELETIVDYSRRDLTIDPVLSGHSYNYWSSSTDANNQDDAWNVYFDNGHVIAHPKSSNSYYVRCVRGGPFWLFDPLTHLQTPTGKPGTVLDTYWGYMWQKGDSADTGANWNWDRVKAYCDNLVLDGYSDWRLPEIEALLTIIDYTHSWPALSTIFDPCHSYNYWSSSTVVYHQDDAWLVDFTYGRVNAHGKRFYLGYVRCLRGGP